MAKATALDNLKKKQAAAAKAAEELAKAKADLQLTHEDYDKIQKELNVVAESYVKKYNEYKDLGIELDHPEDLVSLIAPAPAAPVAAAPAAKRTRMTQDEKQAAIDAAIEYISESNGVAKADICIAIGIETKSWGSIAKALKASELVKIEGEKAATKFYPV